MILKTPLLEGVLIKRYKRFLADVQLISGEKVTVFCPNSGSMKGCNIPGSPVLLSKSNNPARKYEYTWELVKVNGVWVGINTHHPNYLVREAIESRKIPELDGYTSIRMEVPYGKSRMDMLLEKGRDKCYVEVKNVTLVEEKLAKFPDAVTTRGQKHLRELMDIVKEGYRGVIFFVVQRADATSFTPAKEIDPEYARLLKQAASSGVEILVYQTEIIPPRVSLIRKLPMEI